MRFLLPLLLLFSATLAQAKDMNSRLGVGFSDQFGLLGKVNVLGHARDGATFLLNSPFPADKVWGHLPESIQEVQSAYRRLRDEIRKVIVGQDEVVDQMLMAILCRGHAIVVGVPGWRRRCSSRPSPARCRWAFRASSSRPT